MEIVSCIIVRGNHDSCLSKSFPEALLDPTAILLIQSSCRLPLTMSGLSWRNVPTERHALSHIFSQAQREDAAWPLHFRHGL